MEAIIIFQDGLTAIKFFLHKADRDYRVSMKVTRGNSTTAMWVRQGKFCLKNDYQGLDIPANADQPGGRVGHSRPVFVLAKTDHFTGI